MKKLLVGIFTTLLVTIAVAASAGACFVFGYQPKLPEALKK